MFKNGLDMFHMKFMRIYMGTGMELGFMDCYLLLIKPQYPRTALVT